ncbi:MAG: hypothetical protein JSV25_15930 [Spirochaetota bacterium]|nr:MAG: hypothetical protein JSV25_15930 [Spirochaetota bacterium]
MRHISKVFIICLILIYSAYLPLDGNNTTNGINIEAVKRDPTFNKSMNGFMLNMTPLQMEYFLNYLPYTSYLLNEYGIHTLRISFIGSNKFHAEDDSGLEGTFDLINEEKWYREYTGKGWIKSGVISTISADVVASISFQEASQGQIVNDLEFWVKVDSVILDFLCKLFRPILLQILTKKFDHFVQVIQSFVIRVQEDPKKAAQILRQKNVNEIEVDEFMKVFSEHK